MEPRASETRNSLDEEGCELTVVSGWGNAMTYAVGWRRGGGEDDPDMLDESGDALDDVSTVGYRSHTMSILSSIAGHSGRGQ